MNLFALHAVGRPSPAQPIGHRSTSENESQAIGRQRRLDVSNCRTSTPRAHARRQTLSIEMFRCARSTDPRYVRCIPARSASASCDNPRCARSRRRLTAMSRRPSVGLPGDGTGGVCCFTALKVEAVVTTSLQPISRQTISITRCYD